MAYGLEETKYELTNNNIHDPPFCSRRISQPSVAALESLTTLEHQIEKFESETSEIESKLSETLSKKEFIELRNSLRQAAGFLEKFQYVKVDAIITAELNSGKDEAKTRRKECNKHCDAIRDRHNEALTLLNGKIDAMTDPA